MADLRYLEWRLSGGASNTTPAASLGGAMSTVSGGLVYSQDYSWTPLAAMTIVNGANNATGAGTLQFVLSTTSVRWMPYTGAYGPFVDINTDGTYTLYDSTLTSMIIITKSGTLPASDSSATVTVTNKMNNLFDDVTFAQSLAGMTDYRCAFFKNVHGSETMNTLRVWIAQDPVGPSVFTMGVDPNGINNVAVTIADENTAPTGVTFSTPTQGSPLTLGNVPFGQTVAFWIKRTLPANSENGGSSSLAKIGVSWL